ncbi:hypothetical protein BpHYR1_026168 [Brachionus plicatilis]|uniref:Uncharacterized protein n=1 Tax=Brachionus plicatilis TaxID=10195 RepID=A0A3M7T7J3_BRAPC|nr:hypothetical protein BpHYR1_026168 [Brachionus plicatilis]
MENLVKITKIIIPSLDEILAFLEIDSIKTNLNISKIHLFITWEEFFKVFDRKFSPFFSSLFYKILHQIIFRHI